MKEDFINSELWILTIGAAFQRSYIYPPEFLEKDKFLFKEKLKAVIDEITISYQTRSITEQEHVSNIWKIVNNISNSYTLNLNFGIAQKLLNLHLKYQWCLCNLYTTPPHFTVDRIIQVKLNELAKKNNIECRKIIPWTRINSEKEYLEIINYAELVKSKSHKYKAMSLVELELELFKRY